jgi:hypothetical protein
MNERKKCWQKNKHQHALPETRSASDHADDSTASCDSARKTTIKDRGEDIILLIVMVPKNVYVFDKEAISYQHHAHGRGRAS